MQGEVRSKFEENKLNASEFLKEYFPPDVNPLPYRSVLNAETERMCQYLSRKFEMDKRLEELLSFPNINGEIMCKRYCIDDASIILKPDNQSGDFCDIDVSKAECTIQGKVLLE